MTKYYKEIDLLKGVAILLVLLGHSIIVSPINLKENIHWCSVLFTYIYFFHMPLFFIASGFLFSYKGKYKEYIIKKFKRLMLPYFAISIIDLILRTMLPTLALRNFSIVEGSKRILLYGGDLWFVYTLFIIFLLFPVIEKLFTHKSTKIITIIALVCINFSTSMFHVTDLFGMKSVFIHLLYFAIGYLLKNIYTQNFINIFSKYYITLILVVSFVLIGQVNNPATSMLKALIGSAMIYSIVIKVKTGVISNILKCFGTYSLQIYLLNGYLLVISRYIIINRFHITNPVIVVSMIFVAIALAGIIISNFILNKFLITRVLYGIVKAPEFKESKIKVEV